MGEYVVDDPLSIEAHQRKRHVLDDYLIRLIDIMGSLSGLIMLFPVMMMISIAIRLDSKGSAIFLQKRAGKNGRIFTIYKFRTMCNGADGLCQEFRNANEPVVKMPNDARITRVGAILRKISMDELPQLLNVLKGEMSLVGPRPCILKEVEAYNQYQRLRLQGKPGITGLAQINGRSDLDFDKIVELDICYNNNRSFMLYLKVLFLTVPYAIFGKSSY